MAQLYQSRATLRLIGDSLDSDEVTRLLGATPTAARKKGAIWRTPNGRELISRIGIWRLEATDREPEDLDGQVAEVLGKLTDNLEIWAGLSRRFRIDLFCGWYMAGSNEGVDISPGTLAALGARGVTLGLDIYDGSLPSRREPRDQARVAEWNGRARLATKADADAWLAMRVELWPDAEPDELRGEVTAFFTARSESLMPHQVFVAEADGKLIGMLELSLRPYVDGCESSPVPFIEAWYVAPDMRRQGIGGALIKAVEEWVIAHGHTEIASDTLLDNKIGERAHTALGFEEIERAIRFRKALKG